MRPGSGWWISDGFRQVPPLTAIVRLSDIGRTTRAPAASFMHDGLEHLIVEREIGDGWPPILVPRGAASRHPGESANQFAMRSEFARA
jgi:hypothetical protein